jgi:hypothetical protein
MLSFRASDSLYAGRAGKDSNLAQLPASFLSGDCIVMGSRQSSATKPKRMSLAQFSKNLMSGESQGQLDFVGSTTEGIGLESAGQKRFAADVVAAMSNPATAKSEPG